MNKDLSKLIWVALPVVVFLVPYLSRMGGIGADLYLYGEDGWIEILTVIFLLVAIFFGVTFLLLNKVPSHGWIRWWMVLLILGSIYFAGEEASWGQHFLGFSTPEYWQGFNDQGETNLHNTSPLFDQLPRTLLSAAALIGGVLVPLYFLFVQRYPKRSSLHYWLWPTYVCVPAAFLSLLVSWHEKAYKFVDVEIPVILDVRAGEVKESLLALFIMIYIVSIWYRSRCYQGKS
ncbi:MAG: hypothetical protein OXC42_02220 [Gammaproteobacteria bacterium]|nr:hypothetical protein [Gammaproteobacteria bacterium]